MYPNVESSCMVPLADFLSVSKRRAEIILLTDGWTERTTKDRTKQVYDNISFNCIIFIPTHPNSLKLGH